MSRRILIVDDNPTNLRLAASVLSLDGHAVDQAGDAEQALAYLESTQPDLILMDIALPGMDGLTLTRRLKADPALRHIPVVALTAFAMKGDEEKARDAGCIGYLTKPIDTREFGARVADFLPPVATGTLLIVDDNPTNLRLLRAQLEAEGLQVVEACHGEEALERLAQTPVDGVISDILMPRMDGYRLCLEVRKDPRFAELPFVLYTSTYNSPADRTLARSAGADAYLAKPAPVRQLLGALKEASTRIRTPVQPAAEIEDPVLKQYSESLIRKLEEKSTQLGAAYEGLAQTEARLSGLVESAMDAIIALDETQHVLLFNAAAERMFGCTREQAIGKSLDMFIPERFRHAHHHQVQAFGRGDESARSMGARLVWARRQDGGEFPVEASISRLGTSKGWLFTVFLRDVTERHKSETALASSESRLRRMNRVLSVLSGINTLIVRATERGELLQQSCRIAMESGQFPKAWIGLLNEGGYELAIVASAGIEAGFLAELQERVAGPELLGSDWANELRAARPVVFNRMLPDHPLLTAAMAAGTQSLALLPLAMADQVVGVLVLHATEIGFFDDEEMALLKELAGDIAYALDHLGKAERLRYLTSYDALTGLPNRALFTDYVTRALRSRASSSEGLAVMLVDIERFRRVNETLGRDAGDDLLRQVGNRLRRHNESAARLGSDVYAVKLQGVQSAEDIVHDFNRLREACFGAPCTVAGENLRIGCRAGVAVFPTDGDDAEALLRNAEAALRRARTASEPLVFYAPELNARAAEAMNLESRLRRAIDQQEFVLHYQPKVGMVDRLVTGVEALIRWQDPEQGLVPPGRFIPVLEECGLIGEVGRWALQRALHDQSQWWEQGVAAPRVAVNVSPLQLRRQDFADDIVALVANQPLHELELEITESVIMDNVERNIAALATVRAAGVTVAVDDFGTGYCSLSYIAKLPVTSLKIDRAFIVGMTSGPQGLAIVSSIIALAHALRLKVVAEGVETEEQARLLHLLGCDEAQGYLFCRPVPADAIAALLRRGLPLPAADG
jgi:diguanylate cyclase (GGDEF)-like protein/PAS domain S-box-containing protein